MKRALAFVALCSFLGCQNPSDVEPVAADLESKDVAASPASDVAADRDVVADHAEISQTEPTSPEQPLAEDANPSPLDVAAEIDRTIEAFQQEGTDFMVRYRQIPPEQQREFYEKERPDGAKTVRRLAELAQADPENPAVLKAAAFVASLGNAAGGIAPFNHVGLYFVLVQFALVCQGLWGGRKAYVTEDGQRAGGVI